MRNVLCALITCGCVNLQLPAQLSGTVSVPGTYSSMVALLSDLNLNGVAGSLTVNIAAGYSETAIPGGYTLTASGTVTNPVLFRKYGAGSNPVFYAYAGSKTPGSAVQDGLWRLVGCDHITIDGIDLVDLNTTNPSTMEFGFALFKGSASDGCHHITIRNCRVALKSSNNSTGSGPATDGSRGFEIVNALPSAHNAALSITSSNGTHAFNRFFSNVVNGCNIGFAFTGFVSANATLRDAGNEIGSLLASEGNTVVNFGGGGSNGSAGIRAFAQHDLLIAANYINSDNGPGAPHAGTLRGIHIGAAPSADISVVANTVTIHGGGTGSNLSCIENAGGGAGTSNTVLISGNQLLNSTYNSATNGSFYGIWNSASAGNLIVRGNVLHNNSSGATGGPIYLLYNNGAVAGQVSIDSNMVGFKHFGPGTYTGTLYGIYNTAAGPGSTISISANQFKSFMHEGGMGTGPVYFIYNTADVTKLGFTGNKWKNLQMNHSGAEYFIYNSSSTSSLLAVTANSVTGHTRSGPSANLYGYYGAATVVGTATQVIADNLFSNITSTVTGPGNFYGIYSGEGNTSPYPLKTISGNTISNIVGSGSGNFYAIYASDLGDGGSGSGSLVENNVITGCEFLDAAYGLYCTSSTSPSYPARVRKNLVRGITSYTGSAYGAYLGSNNAGIIFSANKLCNVVTQGTSGAAYGLYCASTSTSNIVNNIIGHIDAPMSGGANKCNGIYISTGSLVNVYYNSVYIHAASSGSNFGTNALYVSSTASLDLRNNILVNTSTVTGSGIGASYRRSSSSLVNYNQGAGNNFFFSGVPSGSNPVFYNGTSYASLASFKTFVSPREVNSVSQAPSFVSTVPLSPQYMHLLTYASSMAEGGAMMVNGLVSDFDDQARQGSSGYGGTGSAPDIGADEFETYTTPCSSVSPAGIHNNSVNACAGQTLALFASSLMPGSGLQHVWKVGSSPGGPYSSVSAGPEYFSAPLAAGDYFFVLESACPSASAVIVSAEVTVSVLALPVASAIAQSAFLCAGDTIKLSVAGNAGMDFHWTGPGGFYSSEQHPVVLARNASLSGNYFAEVTDGACVSLPGSPATVTVHEVEITVTATRSVICTGDSVALTAQGPATDHLWSTGATGSSVFVSPVVTSSFSVSVQDSTGCKDNGAVSVAVVNATIAPVHATVCGWSLQASLGVSADYNSFVEWYSSPGSSTPMASGSSFTMAAASSATVFASATALWPENLLASMAGNELEEGLMFDIHSTRDIRLNGIDLHLPSAGVHTVSVWQRTGSFLPAITSSVGWNSVGVCTVTGVGYDQLTSLPVFLDIPVHGSQTIALYISVAGGSMYATDTGTFAGAWASNNDLSITTGNAGPAFSCTTNGRALNGQLRYVQELCSTPRIPVELLVAPLPTITALSSASMICPGKSATLTASGAATYSWSGGGNNTMMIVHPSFPKTYTVNGKTAVGCAGSATVYVGLLPVPVVTAFAASTLVCPSAPVVLSATGAVSFVWNTGANGWSVSVNPAAQTTYSAYGTGAEGCIGTATITVQTKTVPVIKIQQSADSVCPFNMVVLKASGANSYTWIPGNGTQQTTTVFPSTSAVFNAIGSSINSCTNIAYAFVFVDACAGFSEGDNPAGSSIAVYPNPSTGSFIVTLPPGVKMLKLYDDAGKLLRHFRTLSAREEFDLHAFAPGLYCLNVSNGNLNQNIRLVKE